MAYLVSDPRSDEKKTLKFNLKNDTDFEVTFRIGSRSFTLQPKQTKAVRAEAETSIEAHPGILGIERGFLVGGVKKECSLFCSLDADNEESQALVISPS